MYFVSFGFLCDLLYFVDIRFLFGVFYGKKGFKKFFPFIWIVCKFFSIDLFSAFGFVVFIPENFDHNASANTLSN